MSAPASLAIQSIDKNSSINERMKSDTAAAQTRACSECLTVKLIDRFEPHRHRCKECRGRYRTTLLRRDGRCRQCYKPSLNGKTACESCLEKRREQCKRQRLKRRANRKCLLCGRPWQGQRKCCRTCLDQQRCTKLIRRYGIRIEDYWFVFMQQGGVCAICKEEGPRPLSACPLDVDHDHRSKLVRGLLCAMCNRSIGMMNEDPMRLRAAALYVETHRDYVPGYRG